jgi:two-component system C4-dicarboxylate transport response regulator DctD
MNVNDRTLRILVVDDEPLIRWAISQTFAARGHTVIEASDGRGARETVSGQHERPDAIVLDYRLPDSKDFTLLDDLTRLVPGRPIILITAEATPELVENALEHGAAAVLSKPFDLSDLESIVLNSCRPTVH